MLLAALRRPGGALLTVSPLLCLVVAVLGASLLLLPFLAAHAARSGAGVQWAFFWMYAFFVGMPCYVFAKAALGQQVRCQLDAGRVNASYRGQDYTAELTSLRLRLGQRKFGLKAPVVTHTVTLSSPQWREELTLHMGFTRMGAEGTLRRISEHLRISVAT